MLLSLGLLQPRYAMPFSSRVSAMATPVCAVKYCGPHKRAVLGRSVFQRSIVRLAISGWTFCPILNTKPRLWPTRLLVLRRDLYHV